MSSPCVVPIAQRHRELPRDSVLGEDDICGDKSGEPHRQHQPAIHAVSEGAKRIG